MSGPDVRLMKTSKLFYYSALYLAVYVLAEFIAEVMASVGGIWEDLAWAFWSLPWGYWNAVIAAILGLEIWRMRRSMEQMDTQLKASRDAFQATVASFATDWKLSAAEQNVLLLMLKGCSHAQIAQMRDTAEGTVKAQAARIYQKSGFANKNELLSALIEDLTGGHALSEGP